MVARIAHLISSFCIVMREQGRIVRKWGRRCASEESRRWGLGPAAASPLNKTTTATLRSRRKRETSAAS